MRNKLICWFHSKIRSCKSKREEIKLTFVLKRIDYYISHNIDGLFSLIVMYAHLLFKKEFPEEPLRSTNIDRIQQIESNPGDIHLFETEIIIRHNLRNVNGIERASVYRKIRISKPYIIKLNGV